MKPALVLIPRTIGTVNRQKYLSRCIRHVMNEDSFPLARELYDSYMTMEETRFVDTMLGICSTVYLFIDFGMDDLMTSTVEKAAKQDIPASFVKVVQNEPQYLSLTPQDILQEISDITKVPVEALKSKSRYREVADARQIYFRRAREVLGPRMTYAMIGSEVNRDHATVMYGIKKANDTKELKILYQEYYGSNGTGRQ